MDDTKKTNDTPIISGHVLRASRDLEGLASTVAALEARERRLTFILSRLFTEATGMQVDNRTEAEQCEGISLVLRKMRVFANSMAPPPCVPELVTFHAAWGAAKERDGYTKSHWKSYQITGESLAPRSVVVWGALVLAARDALTDKPPLRGPRPGVAEPDGAVTL